MKKNEKTITLLTLLQTANNDLSWQRFQVDKVGEIKILGGNIRLTPFAKSVFSKALSLPANEFFQVWSNDETDYSEDVLSAGKGKLNLAMTLLNGLQGYCSYDEYEQWFCGTESELI